ncbi:hypothetical protein TrVGV298_008725 [Trichoderma virens]|nr:hypothetical protein TrVGV298_008725 [Trichoderma virens]
MAEVLEIAADAPMSADEGTAPTPPDVPLKGKSRQRILRGIQRISSSPSLPGVGRSRSISNPYSIRYGSISCVSLSTAGPSQASPRSATPQLSALNVTGASHPGSKTKVFMFEEENDDDVEEFPAIRKLWTSIDASEFYQEIPAASLARIIAAAGPFVKDLNLRGCVQVEHYKRTEVIVKSCKNLMNATLEGCRNFQKHTLHNLLRSNEKLVHLNLTGLAAVTNTSCKIIAESCPQLESFNVSWCQKVEARGIKTIIDACTKLRDLRAGERLVLSGCSDLNDEALKIMMQGVDPEIDILTGHPVVPARRLRHLDLSRCIRLTSAGVKAIGHVVPDLEGLQLSGCKTLTDAALELILASTPRLTHLELEDLDEITNSLLSEHLAKAPCAGNLEHLSLSYCENIGDLGMLPVMQKCIGLKSADLDNTRISDLVLAEAASMVIKRSKPASAGEVRPKVTLRLAVYDCQNVTWTGIREILFRNAQVRPAVGQPGGITYPTESIGLKCFYGFQMTVDEHQKRVLRGDLVAAGRLERKWADYMQANEEAGAGGAGYRRRRRRARHAQALHADEEDGGIVGRRRARTLGSCSVM